MFPSRSVTQYTRRFHRGSARPYLRKCATEAPALDSGEILTPEMVTQDSGIMTTITGALTLEEVSTLDLATFLALVIIMRTLRWSSFLRSRSISSLLTLSTS